MSRNRPTLARRFSRLSAVLFTVAVVAGIGIANPIPASAATYAGQTEVGGATCTNSGSGPSYLMNCSWSAGTSPGTPNTYLRQVWLCNGVWHYGITYTDYNAGYPSGSYSFSYTTAPTGTSCPTPVQAMGLAFTGYSGFSVMAGGSDNANTTIASGSFGRLLDAYYVPGYTPGPSPAPTGAGNNCTITDQSLVRLARGAGFPESSIQTAVAVAIAESASKVNALRYNAGSDSYDIGLWQINDVAHPTYDRNLLYTSPGYNALKAYDVFHTATPTIDRFTPWVAFTNGSYNKFMSRAATALQAAPTGTLGGNACNDLSGSDVVDSATDDNTQADDDPNCTFTINVLKILKCVFIPSAQQTASYKTKIDTVRATPPISTVEGGMTIIKNVVDPGTTCGGTCPAGNDPYNMTTHQTKGAISSTAGGPNTLPYIAMNPLQKAGDWVQNSSGTPTLVGQLAHVMYLMMQFGIVALFARYWFMRFTESLGGKS